MYTAREESNDRLMVIQRLRRHGRFIGDESRPSNDKQPEATRRRVWIMDPIWFGCTGPADCTSALEASSISPSCFGRVGEESRTMVRLSLTRCDLLQSSLSVDFYS